ncbi:hypothetical protein [Streptomyces sp. NBC_00342]|uniref:hypothetical protein n=1 Tax=Streptomyces sp. NBC_00342 TaxID=2975718 RepID=UPI002E2C4A50|nr:hypothetical protein [Streptomyces sp. NBC_00342]
MTTNVPQPPAPPTAPPPAPAPAPAPPTAPATAPWVVAVLTAIGTMLLMGLCVGVAVVAWLRPGASTPITVMAAVMGSVGTVATPLVSVALTGRRQR